MIPPLSYVETVFFPLPNRSSVSTKWPSLNYEIDTRYFRVYIRMRKVIQSADFLTFCLLERAPNST